MLPLAATLVSALASAGPTSVPFTATLVTQERITPNFPGSGLCPGFVLTGATAGSGTAMHLGNVTGSGSDCVNPTSPFTFAFSHGKLTMVAVDGDVLHADYAGTLRPSATPPMFTVAGQYTITGGTGRFANASGNGTVGGLENIQTGQGQLTFSGAISY